MTELVWDGKYTADGKRSAPVRVALPFQTVETVNESAQQRQLALDFFAHGREAEWRNRLIWGDKKYVLPSLLPEFAGKVDLIYIDPPFDTGADFSFTTRIPDSDASFTKEPSIIEQKAYRDTWGRGLDSYLQWFYETVVLLHELLAETGSIYVHLDWRLVHYARAVLDEVFGIENYRNDITWKRAAVLGRKAAASQFGRVTDTILYYSRNESAPPTWNRPYIERIVDISNYRWDEREQKYFKTSPRGDYTDNSIAMLRTQNRIYDTGSGGIRIKYFLDRNMQGQWIERLPADSLWLDIPDMMHIPDKEKTAYPTQKPEALLERIINASSNEGDLVLDCFCGSGTTAAVAEKLGRRWITCDLGRFAIQTTRKRLLSIDNVRPFMVQNLGKYERQAWQAAEFRDDGDGPAGSRRSQGDARSQGDGWNQGDARPQGDGRNQGEAQAQEAAARQAAYRRFILDLYGAEPLEGYAWLHGLKNGRFVHVGPVDAPVTAEDVKAVARECWRTGRTPGTAGFQPAPVASDVVAHPPGGTGRQDGGDPKGTAGTGRQDAGGPRDLFNAADVLGWDFAFEVNETAKAIAAEANVRLSFKRIPREVLEKRAVEQGDIRFFELAALSLDVAHNGRAVTVSLRDFIMPPDDVPADVQAAITHWSQWIDYWAVDWDFKDDTFHNQWQSYRTRKDPTLQCQVAHTYDEPGAYTIVVKVIDILGNDTTRGVTMEIP